VTEDVASSTLTVDADGVPIRYVVEGPEKAPVVLLSNSLGTDLTMWDAQAAAWSREHRVVRYDTRGHGRSGAPAMDYTLDRLGADALAVLDAVGATRAAVVGVSLGGQTALWLAVNAPERITRAVAANTAPKVGTAEAWNERIALIRSEGMDAVSDAVVDRFFSPAFQRAHPEVVAAVLAIVRGTDADGYAGCCAALRDADLRPDVGRISQPLLVIGGQHDLATPVAEAVDLKAAVPGARLELLEAAHLSNLEEPEAFTRLVGAFLAEGSAGRAGPPG
jgi:3-oxoadipate enol-lactonase